MAAITPDTFDPLRRYVSVRLQQGVPIVDADWNEKDDMRRFELRAYLKWFVGNGVPFGTDAFRIAALPVPLANDLEIGSGVPIAPPGTSNYAAGLRHLGRCLVEGAEATIEATLAFRSQALHASQPGAAALAVLRGVPVIAEMPVLNGTVCIYLDLWDRLVRPDEVPALVFADIGTESCARIRAEWVVRARIGTTAPQAGDADHLPGHVYYALARVARVAGDPAVYAGQIEDQREQHLMVPPATLIEDMLGTTPDRYRRGLDRPVMPLRSVMNALLKGELPGTVDQVIAPDPASDFATRAIVHTGTETVVSWHSTRVGGTSKVFITSWPDTNPAGAAAAPVQVTVLDATSPALVLLPTAPVPSYLLAYTSQNDVRFRRAGSVAALAAAVETPVAATIDAETHPVVIRTGSIVTVFWFRNGPGVTDTIRYRRRQYDPTWTEAAAVWLDAVDTIDLSSIRPAAASLEPWNIHAAADAAGRIWVAFRSFANNIAVARLTPGTGAVDNWLNLELDSGTQDEHPFVLIDGAARVWLFWRADGGIFHSVHDVAANTWGPSALIPGTNGPAGDNERPCAVRDAEGGIWLFWAREAAGPKTDIWVVWRNPATGGWGLPRQVTGSPGNNDFPLAYDQGGALRTFFRSNRSGNFDLFTKSLITRI
jgi:hypothetical protein